MTELDDAIARLRERKAATAIPFPPPHAAADGFRSLSRPAKRFKAKKPHARRQKARNR